jgi:hypothetical protein
MAHEPPPWNDIWDLLAKHSFVLFYGAGVVAAYRCVYRTDPPYDFEGYGRYDLRVGDGPFAREAAKEWAEKLILQHAGAPGDGSDHGYGTFHLSHERLAGQELGREYISSIGRWVTAWAELVDGPHESPVATGAVLVSMHGRFSPHEVEVLIDRLRGAAHMARVHGARLEASYPGESK